MSEKTETSSSAERLDAKLTKLLDDLVADRISPEEFSTASDVELERIGNEARENIDFAEQLRARETLERIHALQPRALGPLFQDSATSRIED